MKNLCLSYFLFYSIIVSSETILCELKGTFEETSEVPKTNYLQDVGIAIKNLKSPKISFITRRACGKLEEKF